MSSSTCSAVVGLGRPLRLALGAAIGQPAARISLRASAFAGRRMPTVSSPALTASGMQSALGRISVIGPGQNASISFRAAAGIARTSGGISSTQATCVISGLSCGRPFASKILATARASSAFAPSP